MHFSNLLCLTFVLFVAMPPLLSAQTVAFGIKVGPEATESILASSHYQRSSSRRVIGPVFEVALPRTFALEAGALHRQVEYHESNIVYPVSPADLGEERESETTAHSWEVALVLKKYMDVGSHVRAYADAGFSGRHTSGTTHTQGFILQLKTTPGPPGPPPVMRTMPFSYDGSPPELKRDWVGGFLLGGGLALKYRFVGLQPELRYTRWSAETFRRSVSPNQSLRSNKNSLDVLFGVTFRR